MPRTEVYQLRLTKSEKDELAERARLQGVSMAKLIRQKLGLDATKSDAPAVVLRVQGPHADPGGADFPRLVAQHKRFMSTRKAEAKARQELERNPS